MATSCQWLRNMNMLGLKHRSGHVVTWVEKSNDRWMEKRALVDWDCDGEIVSQIDSLHLHDSFQNDDWVRENRTCAKTEPLTYNVFGFLPRYKAKLSIVTEPGQRIPKA